MAMTEISLRQPLRYTIDLGAGLVQQPMRGQLMKGDKKANRVIVHLTDGGKDVTLSGVTVTGSFIRPPDAAEIPLTGEASGSEAIVTLDDACYSTEGYCEISVKLTIGETARTILTLTGYVLSKGSGAYVDVSGVIPNIDDVIAQYAEMKRVTQETQAAGTAAGNAAGAANTAADEANRQAQAAQQAAQAANTAASKIDGLTVSAEKADAAGAAISQKDGAYHVNFKLPKGDTGATPDITFEVETGPAGSDVQIEQRGTPEAPVVKLTIPRGDTGAVEGVDYYEGNPKALGEASPGTANGVARGDHVHPKPTPEELGAATIDDITPGAKTTYSSEKIEGELSSLSDQIADVGTPNLLVNSNFQAPYLINLRGLTSYTGGGDTIDRWVSNSANLSVSIESGGLKLQNKETNTRRYLTQIINRPDLVGKTLTFVVCLSDGTIVLTSGAVGPNAGDVTNQNYFTGQSYIAFNNADGNPSVWVCVGWGETLTLRWSALYEGEYTAENFPEPIWLHPRLEMIRMGLPTQPVNLLDNGDFKIAQAGYGGYHGSYRYAADRWKIPSANTVVSYNESTGVMSIKCAENEQYSTGLDHVIGGYLSGKTLTAVVCLSDGTICFGHSYIPTDGTNSADPFSNDTFSLRFRQYSPNFVFAILAKPGKTVEIKWVALYEGTYTLETLPPYRPKEYAVELAECMFRFFRWKANQNNASWAAVGTALSATQARFLVNAPCPMDDSAAASITQSNMRILGLSAAGNTTHEITSISCYSLSGNALYINVDTSGLTVGQTCVLQAKSSGAYVDFSRDL